MKGRKTKWSFLINLGTPSTREKGRLVPFFIVVVVAAV